MRIKSIDIKNFRSYYGENNHFEFSDGLTLILGDNGDGKTTFFEALEWLFDTTSERANLSNVSEMRKSKLEIGEHDEVYVAMTFDHDGEKMVEKSFSIVKTGHDIYSVSNASYHGYETNGIERESVDGKQLITRCYDSFIRRFSMFKGESDLSVFDNAASLKTLVDKFSDIHKFDGLVANTDSFEQKANKALLQEMKSDDKISKETKSLELQMTRLSGEIQQNKEDIKDKKDAIATFSSNLNKLEQNQETSEKYRDIQERLKTKTSKKTQLMATIKKKDYNHCLLDEYWILAPFGDVLTEFKQKCAALSKERRVQEKNFDKQQAAAKAKLETIKEIQGALVNGATELPWYLPNQETMEDMINCLGQGIIPHVITDDGKDGYELEIPYKEVTEVDTTSIDPKELKKALHAGKIPEVYKDVISEMRVEEVRRKVVDEAGEKAEVCSAYGTPEEMQKRAKEGYFVRDPERNLVYCPAGEILRQKCIKKNGNIRYANKNACKHCKNRNKCYKGKNEWKEIDFTKDQLQKPCKDWLKAEGKAVEETKRKETWRFEKTNVVKFFLKPNREKTSQRMCISEHPFGTIKRAMGASYFLLRGIRKVAGEFALYCLGYNLERAKNLLGFNKMMELMEKG